MSQEVDDQARRMPEFEPSVQVHDSLTTACSSKLLSHRSRTLFLSTALGNRKSSSPHSTATIKQTGRAEHLVTVDLCSQKQPLPQKQLTNTNAMSGDGQGTTVSADMAANDLTATWTRDLHQSWWI
jgi:hypothetical protein